MNKSAIPVQIRALIPTNAGTAVFLGNDEKIFTIYIDQAIGAAISLYLNNTQKERPLTHDLLANVLTSLGAKVERIVINDFRNGIYYGRLIITAENELQQRKIIELDARSSDCMAMAALQKSPIYVSGLVWDEVEDMTPLLERLQQGEEGTEGGTEKEEE
ncbi:MAG: bifunctional nuclease family protein [Spartobacteria bacterium]